MIPKGLKVGDTFVDDGLTYQVTKIVELGYESRLVENAPKLAPKEVVEEAQKVEAVEEEDYLSLPYAQLKKLCADRGLDATGKKSDLIARLEG